MTNYSTPDLYLSAFLKSKGCYLKGINEEKRRVFFLFEGEELKTLVREYFNNSNIPVLSYKSALQDLRAIIKNEENFYSVGDNNNENGNSKKMDISG